MTNTGFVSGSLGNRSQEKAGSGLTETENGIADPSFTFRLFSSWQTEGILSFVCRRLNYASNALHIRQMWATIFCVSTGSRSLIADTCCQHLNSFVCTIKHMMNTITQIEYLIDGLRLQFIKMAKEIRLAIKICLN